MGTIDYQSLLTLLEELCATLEHLTAVEQDKAVAVRQDDLNALNDCMKREQVLSLTLRGLDQKREAGLAALGLSDVALSALAEHVPQELRIPTAQIIDRLRRQYHVFQGASEVARDTLECNLHQIETVIKDLGGGPDGGPGYREKNPELPPAMRADFRA